MPKRVLCVFAHPDDEAFGPGGTIALWAQQGAEIYIFCATKGEAGINDPALREAEVRVTEFLNSAKILGAKQAEFLNFKDGQLCNIDLPKLEGAITERILKLQPDTILTFNFNGVSGHIDHIVVASAASHSFKKTKIAKKIYYYTEKKELTDKIDDYFVYFPPGITKDQADEVIDVSSVYETRLKAMHCHHSQQKDIEWLLKLQIDIEKTEYFKVTELG